MATAKKKARLGRPPKGAESMAAPVSVRFKVQQLETIDSLVAAHPLIEDRNTMIRSLVERSFDKIRAEIKLLKRAKK
jgi:hypothetical protein